MAGGAGPRCWQQHWVMLLIALATASVVVQHVQPSPIYTSIPVELQPSVLLLGVFDWETYDTGNGSRCLDMVKRAAGLGISRVNFVITAHYQDTDRDGGVDSYCYMRSGMYCEGVHRGIVNLFRDQLKTCFSKASRLGLDISVVPHLDEGVRKNAAWRNALVFDPLAKLNGWSYEEVLLNPIADALAAALSEDRRVWFAMQGEMSATVLRFPNSYAAIRPRLQQRVHKGRGSLDRVKIGLSFNFNKLHDGTSTLLPVSMLAGPPDSEPDGLGTAAASSGPGGLLLPVPSSPGMTNSTMLYPATAAGQPGQVAAASSQLLPAEAHSTTAPAPAATTLAEELLATVNQLWAAGSFPANLTVAHAQHVITSPVVKPDHAVAAEDSNQGFDQGSARNLGARRQLLAPFDWLWGGGGGWFGFGRGGGAQPVQPSTHAPSSLQPSIRAPSRYSKPSPQPSISAPSSHSKPSPQASVSAPSSYSKPSSNSGGTSTPGNAHGNGAAGAPSGRSKPSGNSAAPGSDQSKHGSHAAASSPGKSHGKDTSPGSSSGTSGGSKEHPPPPAPTESKPVPSPEPVPSSDPVPSPEPEPSPEPVPSPHARPAPSLWNPFGLAPLLTQPPTPTPAWHRGSDKVDVGAVASLLKAVAFIGISSYSEQLPGFGTSGFQNSATRFFGEVKQGLGVDLPTLMNKHNIELHYSEFGLGGGVAEDGSKPASTAWQAGTFPYLGVWGKYNKQRDPWQNPEVRSYMHTFFDLTLQWLTQGGGPKYRVSALFLWDVGSWDVLGIYPESTIHGQGTYRDQVVVDMVRAHNKAVQASVGKG